MNDRYRDNEFPMFSRGLVGIRIECPQRLSLFCKVSIIRNIDRYLRLEDKQILLMSHDGEHASIMDATELINGSVSLVDALGFAEANMESIDLFEMHGTWNEMVDVSISHAGESPFMSVFVPMGTNTELRRRIALAVRKGIHLSD